MNQDQDIIMKCQEKTKNEYFMKEAFKEARKAYNLGEVPVGAIIVRDGRIIARGHNKKEYCNNPINHAEIVAIQKAAKKIGDWRLNDCSLYVTLEPCPMCVGAIIQARLKRIVYGTRDLKSGAVDSIINLLEFPWNHKVEAIGGVLAEECMAILQDFFSEIRKK